jgi:hypothetical protein
MCDDCFQDLIYRFDSQKEYEGFGTIIQNKCINKKLEIIKREEWDYFAPFDPFEFYKCNSCGEIWVLSIAESAWRGFFLTRDKADKYVKELKEKDKKDYRFPNSYRTTCSNNLELGSIDCAQQKCMCHCARVL